MSQQQFNHFLTIWKWTVGVFGAIFTAVIAAVAGILGVYMSNVQSSLDTISGRLDSIDRTLIEMNGKIERNTALIEQNRDLIERNTTLLETHINDKDIHNPRRQ